MFDYCAAGGLVVCLFVLVAPGLFALNGLLIMVVFKVCVLLCLEVFVCIIMFVVMFGFEFPCFIV